MGWFGLFGVGVTGIVPLFTTNEPFVVVHYLFLIQQYWEITMMHMEHYISCKGFKLLWMLLDLLHWQGE